MTKFVDELSRVISVAKSWLGRELSQDEVRKLVTWLEAETAGQVRDSTQIDQGLAAASAVIAEGRQAAETAMNQAFQSVRGGQQAVPGSGPPSQQGQSLQERLASTEKRVLESVLQNAAEQAMPHPSGGELPFDLAQLAANLSELIKIEVREQVDLYMVEFGLRIDQKLADIANAATEVTNRLSADIREQLVRDIAQQATKETRKKKI